MSEALWRQIADMILMTKQYPQINIAIKHTLSEHKELINSIYTWDFENGSYERTLLMISCLAFETKSTLDTVKMLLEISNINQRRTDGSTILHVIVSNRNIQNYIPVIELLLGNGVDLSIADNSGNTVMHIILSSNYNIPIKTLVNIVNIFLDMGVDPFVENKKGIIPYIYICVNAFMMKMKLMKMKRMKIVKRMLKII